jgi:formylglycine-generating enzyme required for sulfatase activity
MRTFREGNKSRALVFTALLLMGLAGCGGGGSGSVSQGAAPSVSPAPGRYAVPPEITLSWAPEGTTIYYTLDGSTPTPESEAYSGPFPLSVGYMRLRAIAFKGVFADSAMAAADYTVTGSPDTPAFSLAEGAYPSAAVMGLTSSEDAVILYTTDGSLPTYSDGTATGTPYTIPFQIVNSQTVKAIAYAPDGAVSPLAERDIAITGTTPNPGFTYTEPTTGIELIWVPAGSFVMGDVFGGGYANELPSHGVDLTQGFWIGKYEVTQAQYELVTGANPSGFPGSSRPVEMVSWDDVQGFLAQLNTLTGRTFRLPTEAEWEYAALGAGRVEKYAGTSDDAAVGDYAWYSANSGGATHPVGQKLPNGLGLYDMSGNVSEWCGDWYEGYASGLQTDPAGPETGTNRVYRGGNWFYDLRDIRTANRDYIDPTLRYDDIGFRLVLGQ